MMPLILGALVLLPLLAAALTVLLGERSRRMVSLACAVVLLGLCVPVLVEVTGGAAAGTDLPETALGGYGPPLGIRLHADGLAALFLTMTAVVGTVVTAYAAGSPQATGSPAFWPLWLGCWSGLNAVFLSGDLFNTYVGLELVGLCAVALVALGGRGGSRAPAMRAALRYLFVAVLGSLLFLMGVGLLVAAAGTLDLAGAAEALAASDEAQRPAVLALTLMSLGLAMKLALVPMHTWLVPAHAGAPSAVSPLLSALVVKAALFVLLRLVTELPAAGAFSAPEARDAWEALALLLGGLGAAAVLGGALMALRQSRLKPLVAYSTVAQVGWWFLMLPLVAAGHTGAVGGAAALALGHGLAKAALFLAAGHLKDLYGTDEIRVLRGAGQRHPMLVMAMGLAAVGLIGLPVSLGFTGKWQLATAAVAGEQIWILAVIALGTLGSAAYLLRGIAPLLLQDSAEQAVQQGRIDRPEASDDDAGPSAEPVDSWRRWHTPELAPLVLGTLTVVTGLLGVWTGDLLGTLPGGLR